MREILVNVDDLDEGKEHPEILPARKEFRTRPGFKLMHVDDNGKLHEIRRRTAKKKAAKKAAEKEPAPEPESEPESPDAKPDMTFGDFTD